jgi:putative endopeptidase
MRKLAWFGAAALCSVAASMSVAATTGADTGSWGFDMAGRDLAVRPGDNFFDYANGTYVKNLVIPPDQSRYGAFNVLRDLSEARTHTILDQAAANSGSAPSAPVAKAGAYYKAFMNEGADFAKLNGLATKTFLSAIFDLSVAPDAKDPTHYAIYLSQSGLGMPDRDYYISPEFADKRGKYAGFVERMLALAGWPDAHASAAKILDFETKIAQASWSL